MEKHLLKEEMRLKVGTRIQFNRVCVSGAAGRGRVFGDVGAGQPTFGALGLLPRYLPTRRATVWRRLAPMLRAVRLHRAAAVVRRFATAPPDLFAVLGVEVRRTAWLLLCLPHRLPCVPQRRFDLDAAELHGSYKALMVRSRPYHPVQPTRQRLRIAPSAQARLHPDRFGTASQEEQLSVADQAPPYAKPKPKP